MKCPKCQGEMEEGYLLYPTHYGYNVKTWIKHLEERKVLGMKGAGYEIKDGKKVKTARCLNCGFLENYAK